MNWGLYFLSLSFVPASYAAFMSIVRDTIPFFLLPFRRMPSGFKICSDRFDRFDHFMQTVNMVKVVMSFFCMAILSFLAISPISPLSPVHFSSFLDHLGQFLTTENVHRTFKRLYILYIFLNHSLIIIGPISCAQ